ncbi:PepSY domain-containing protein [Allofranklinella schreckenbergeri]|uniref:PepSY domain-containing protein n=3 Tax=Allofranklinella schreckenbergeri TaxID=1076744 RepID=A0A3M6QE83_9BURK|nr:PepSY domain-containing protein [Allofranklinella schreckenbergeri]RMX10325.1 PepSY domain-containing protein [Allofranklinella schreckenbergeri]
MTMKPLTLWVLSASLVALPAAYASGLSAEQVRGALEKAGYTHVHDLDYDDDGYWEADAVNAAGQAVDLRVDPRTGTVLREQPDDDAMRSSRRDAAQPTPLAQQPARAAAPSLTAEQVRARLEKAGYTGIHDVDYDDDGYWEADAVNRAGQRVDLRIDPHSGAVLRERRDD